MLSEQVPEAVVSVVANHPAYTAPSTSLSAAPSWHRAREVLP